MKTISGVYLATYNINSANSSLSIAQTGYLNVPGGVALYGSAGGNWNVVNDGKIAGEVNLLGGAAFTNLATKLVTGDVRLTSAVAGAGAITNSGQIVGSVFLFNGGAIYNNQNAIINESGGTSLYGVELSGAGKVSNSGAISGKAFGLVASLTGSDVITNNSGGSISGAGVGIELGLPQSSQSGSTIVNLAGGTITGDSGIVASHVPATVQNSGYIHGTTATIYNAQLNGAAYQLSVGDGVYLSAGGGLANYAGGIIMGARYGADVEGVSASVTNAGSIYGAVGVKLHVVGAKLTNTGVIRGNAAGGSGVNLGQGARLKNSGRVIALGGAAVYAASGATVNNVLGGLILGAVGVRSTSGYVTVGNSGKISGAGASQAAVSLFGGQMTNNATGIITEAGLYVSGVSFDSLSLITNIGSISVVGAYVDGVSMRDGGQVVNSGSIAVNGSYSSGVYLKNGGSVTNSGLITDIGDTVFTGVYLKAGGTVTNLATGVISGDNSVYATGLATINNYGRLKGLSGVYLEAGGSIVNHAGAVIRSTATGEAAVYFSTSGVVTNAGLIVGQGHGALLHDGGLVTNESGGVISGVGVGVGLNSGASIANSGSIAAAYFGAFLGDVSDPSAGGGDVSNLAGGTISADTGVAAIGEAASVTNAGQISGLNAVALARDDKTFELGDGISLFGGGTVVNSAGGIINGARFGVYVDGSGSMVTNAGTIMGAQTAIDFIGTGANQLILQTGSIIGGNVVGSGSVGATNELTLQGTGTTANAFDNFDALAVNAGADWTLTGQETFGAVTVDGMLRIKGGLTGAVTVENGGVARFKSLVTGPFAFDGAGELDLGVAYSGQISGFGADDVIDLLAFTASQTTLSFSENVAQTVATLSFQQAGLPAETLTLAGAYTKDEFALSVGSNGSGIAVTFV